MSDTTKQTRRGILAGLAGAAVTPAAADSAAEENPSIEGISQPEAAEPASVLPDGRARTHWMVLANPVRNEFELFFVAGPDGGHEGNVMAQIRLNPDQAERVARQILADLDGWSEQVAKAQKAFGVTT